MRTLIAFTLFGLAGKPSEPDAAAESERDARLRRLFLGLPVEPSAATRITRTRAAQRRLESNCPGTASDLESSPASLAVSSGLSGSGGP